jgi:DNA-binding NtrC family response regulator
MWEHGEETDNLDEVISRHIRRVLSKTKGKVNGPDGAAAFLGINPSTLRNRMKKLGIDYGAIRGQSLNSELKEIEFFQLLNSSIPEFLN